MLRAQSSATRPTRTLHKRVLTLVTASAIALAGSISLADTAMAASAPGTATATAPATYRADCADTTAAGQAHCLALKRTDVHPMTESALLARPAAAVSGYSPTNLQSAYNLASAAASGGSGQTVAVVDAFDDPNAAADLAVYRSQFGLSACTVANGCFAKVNENGGGSPLPSPAPASDDWTGEESLDVDMVSAICPNCHIILVEASSESNSDLGNAVNAAVALGAKFVSNSYGGSESSSDSSYDASYYDHPGVAVTASSGDSGYGVEYPAASRYVTAVGGTSLTTASNARGWTESVWSTSSSEGAGSGCSADDAKPTWQTDTGCSRRTVADVSAVADPATGVAVYDTYNSEGGWNVYGGTSVASPIIASVYALAGTPAAGSTPASYPYAHTSSLYDVTSGKTATCSPAYLCTAEVGYDGPTGLGTPDGTTAFSSGTSTGNTVTVTNPGSQSGKVGTAASLQISATDSASGQTLTYTATGLPTGLSISTSGLISGTPTAAGTFSVAVTAKDTTGASGTATFTWTITATTGNTVTVTNPGAKTGTVATAASLQISATDSASGQTLTYTATGLPTGLSISTSGLISGTPTAAGTYSVTVTAKDTTGASGSASFTWTISSGVTSGNLVTNPGFETGALSPWTCTGGAASVVTTPVHSGSYALSATPTSSGTAICSQTISVKANTTYTLSAYVDGAYVFIGTTGDGGTDVSAWTSTSSYGQLSVSFKTGASTTSMTVWVHGWYAQPTYYADDFSVM